ncbi:MAG: phosphate/phosphite/phosphonate ABC transporter substrate-binding protein, partial [Bacillota bacterium]
MKKIRFIFIMALILTVFSGGFVLAKQADWPDEVEFAAVPTESVATMSERLDPIVKELEKALGIKVRLRHASDYRGVIEAIRSEKIEFAMFGPKSYIEARDNYGNCEPIVKQIEDNGSGGYRSCLIASTETDIFSPEDAQGASFAFNDPNSTSGYLVPMTLFLQKLKTKPDNYFSKVTFSGSHEASIITVANGHVEAASTNLEAIKRAV